MQYLSPTTAASVSQFASFAHLLLNKRTYFPGTPLLSFSRQDFLASSSLPSSAAPPAAWSRRPHPDRDPDPHPQPQVEPGPAPSSWGWSRSAVGRAPEQSLAACFWNQPCSLSLYKRLGPERLFQICSRKNGDVVRNQPVASGRSETQNSLQLMPATWCCFTPALLLRARFHTSVVT